ncbi:MAG: PAS domain-containing protein [Tissierellales bacterium]|jgi:predicted transcriptional regulator YheO|nr:PAS domain-containing protein [Tissierellales bacterium]
MSKDLEKEILLESYTQLVDFMAETLGSECEIALHKIEDQRAEIIAIRNGQYSNRKIGDHIDAIGKKVYEIEKNLRYHANYEKVNYQGKEMKSSSFYIRKKSGELIGILCFNFDLTLANMARKYFEAFMPKETEEVLEKDTVNQITFGMIDETIQAMNLPVDRMVPNERIEVIKELREKGVFGIKGAVRQVAKKLEISETSVYRYLKEIE